MRGVIIKREPIIVKGDLYGRIRQVLGNSIEDSYIPYLNGISDFFQNNKLKIRDKNKVIIASDSLYNAHAAALYISRLDISNNNKQDFFNEYEFDLPAASSCRELLELKISDLSSEKAKEFNVGALSDYSIFIEGYSQDRVIADKTMDMLNALSIPNFIHIQSSEVNEAYIQSLRLEQGYCLIKIPEAPEEYYAGCLQDILDENGVKLSISINEIIYHLKNRLKKELSEARILMLVAIAMDKADGKPLGLGDFGLEQSSPDEILKRLDMMPGLKNQKKLLKEQAALLREAKRNPNFQVRRNLVFAGNPGTFKSGFAKLVSEYCSAIGVSNSVHIEATREKLIGAYVGHTSPRIKRIFDEAKGGGIIVIDEAGWMIGKNEGSSSSSFTSEAVKEIVRYSEMPEYADVTIIYNMYSSEMTDFLKLDDGLSSRIGQIIEFSDYTDDELCSIFSYMSTNQGYVLEAGWETIVNEYCSNAKKREEVWGNGREMRKLCQSIITAHALKDSDSNILAIDEIKEGVNRLLFTDSKKPVKVFGFRPVGEEGETYASKSV